MKKLLNDQLRPSKGVTLIELSLIIAVLLILISASTLSVTAYQNWKKGLEAGEDLKAVYQAQKLYLADNPTTLVADITAADIIANLPNGMAAIPTVTGLDGTDRAIIFTQSPPIIEGGYDPSPPGDNSLWDAGK